MKKIIYSSNLITLSLLFNACTPPPVPPTPSKVFENRPIEATVSQPSLGTAIHGTSIQTEIINTDIVREPTETSKVPTEVISSVYQEEVEEDKTQNNETDTTETQEILKEEELTTVPQEMSQEELAMSTLPSEDVTQSSKTPTEEVVLNPYGNPPEDYRATIRTYLAKKANPSDTLKYVFSRPEKAEKKDKSWRGWMVKVDMLKRNGKGKILKNQPYTILFKNSSIVEDFASANPKNITKVVY